MSNYNRDAFTYKNMTLSKKKVAIAIATLLGIILTIIYLIFSIYFQSHFLFGTTINGIDCSGKTVAQVEKLLEKNSRFYFLKLIERDNVVEHINAEDINLQMSLSKSVASVKGSQNPYSWLFSKNNSYNLEIYYSYDSAMLEAQIDSLTCMDVDKMRKPTPSTLVYSDGVYSIKPGDVGTELDTERLRQLIIEGVKNMRTSINLEQENCYLVEKVDNSSELYVLEDKLNKCLQTTINLQFDDVLETINQDLISTWISIDEDNNILFDREAINNYLGTLAKKYETFGCSRQFNTSEGKTVIVKGGDYGWWFDRSAEVTNIINDITNNNSCTRPIAYRQTAATHTEIDIGNTYCEINLTKQKLYLYKEGQLILTSNIISGTQNTKYETPTGTYKLRYKQKSYTFKRSYFNRTVKPWMVFYGSSAEDTIGILGADWINAFGGSIYKTKGSYGSIYVSPADAKVIYNNLPNDSAIVIYK